MSTIKRRREKNRKANVMVEFLNNRCLIMVYHDFHEAASVFDCMLSGSEQVVGVILRSSHGEKGMFKRCSLVAAHLVLDRAIRFRPTTGRV
jgi:hypothetical protein